MLRKIVLAFMVAAPFLSAVHDAQANSISSLGRSLQSGRKASFISERRPTLAPFAQIRFCVRNPGDCGAAKGSSVLELTAATKSVLQRINTSINSSIRPVNDGAGSEQGDLWQVATTVGDCEDFALTKRRMLIRKGIPSRALRIAIARTASGEAHAVLVVKTSEGDLVLDNRTNTIKPWKRVNLRWIKIQSAENPRLWFAI